MSLDNFINDDYRIVKGKNCFYNTKLKLLKGKNKLRLIIKTYNEVLACGNDCDVKSDLIIDDVIVDNKDNHFLDNLNERIVRQDNIVRARNKVFDYAYMNEDKWKSFITLTYADNFTDIDESYKKFNIWLKQIRRLCKKNNDKFYYLGVIEFQKRGAIHYHVLTNLVCGSIYLPLQENKEKMYDVKYWNYGYTSAFNIIDDVDDNFSVSSYMCKYMTKKNNDIRLLNHKRYYHSYNLDKPMEKVCLKSSTIYQTLDLYLKDNNINSVNEYHYVPKEQYGREFYLKEYEIDLDDNNIDFVDILSNDLEF